MTTASLSLASLSASFWSEAVWTPPNASWHLYESKGYRNFDHVYYSLVTAVVFIISRSLLRRYVYTPIGQWLGLSVEPRRRQPVNNPTLESVYNKSRGKLSQQQLVSLAKRLDMSEKDISRWLRLRSAQSRPTAMTKFTESAWRFTFYLSAFVYGMYVLWDKPWLTDSLACFVDFPHHRVTDEEFWYYNIEMAFYLGLVFSQFIDIQRKDFWAMFIHHVVTLCLLVFSWACNLVRIGTLVLVIHDFADIPMEFGKMMTYIKNQKLANAALSIFTVFWLVSRLGLYPYRVIYYTSHRALEVAQMFPAYYIFNGLLIALQLLHILWTYFLVRIIYHSFTNNDVKDLRSDDEESTEEDSVEEHSNGTILKKPLNGGGDR